ncbi:MAG: T9SS type A sorting domain-containing protein [Bacteroidales bacterium]
MNKIILYTTLFCLLIVYSGFAQQQLENPGFEYWEEFGFGPDTLEPVDWNSLKSSDGGELINSVIPLVWEQSTDAHSGMYSIKLINMPILTLVAPGTLTNGRVHATLPPTDAYVFTIDSLPEFNTPFTSKPDSLTVWAKFMPEADDIGHVIAILHSDTAKVADSLQTNWIAVANIDFTEETTAWTRFSAPFVYLNNDTPEYILFAIYAGDAAYSQIGSILYLDDFELTYYNTGQQENVSEGLNIWISGDELFINWNKEQSNDLANLQVFDVSGNVLISETITPHKNEKLHVDLQTGIYICKISNQHFTYTEKLIKK